MSEPPTGWVSPGPSPDEPGAGPAEPDGHGPASPPPYGPPPGYGQQQPSGYGAPPGYGQQQPPGYSPAPGYGVPPGYGPPPAYGQQPIGYVQQAPGYGQVPGYGVPAGAGGWPAGTGRKPGIVPLRPLAFSEILDGAFQAIRTNPRTMLGFAAVVLTVTGVISLFPQAWLLTSWSSSLASITDGTDAARALDSALAPTLSVIPTGLINWLAGVVLNALLVVAVSAAVLGQKTSPGDLWKRVRGRVPAAIGLSLLTAVIVGLAAVVAGAVLVVPGIALAVNDQPVLGVLLILFGLLAALVTGVFLSIKTLLAGPVLLLEGTSVGRSLSRSWRLLTGSFWRVLGILIVVFMAMGFVAGALQLPFAIGGAAVDFALDNTGHTQYWPTLLSTGLQLVGQTAAGIIMNPWTAAVVALIYIDLRMRREGFDLELIRATEEGAPR